MSKRVLVILGHPSAGSFCGALAERYAAAARSVGHEVRVLRLGALDFDPVLHEGYRQVQPLEPDLLAAQADISWAEHLAWVYPVWWGGIPAWRRSKATSRTPGVSATLSRRVKLD